MQIRSIMGSRSNEARATNEDPEQEVMERNGITRVVTHNYHVDGYRYTTLAEALSQVRRGASDRALR
jgi:hypothetical protein